MLWIHFLGWLNGLELNEDGILQVRDGDEEEEYPVGFLSLPEDLRAAEMFVDQDGRLTFADDSGAVTWTGPTPEDMGPYPGLPKVRAAIDLDGHEDSTHSWCGRTSAVTRPGITC